MIIGIILSLALLTFIAYRGYSVILFAPICALVAAVTAGLSIMPTYTELFMSSMASYAKSFFPIFMLGAVFGKLMEDSGMARSIAMAITKALGPTRAIFSIVLAGAILTYGGVSLFVAGFAIYPFASAIFLQAGFPRRLIPATIALGIFSFTMTAVPGSPQIQNMIPTKYFGTDLYAAPVFGLIGSFLIFGIGVLWLQYRCRKMIAAGEDFGELDSRLSVKVDDGVPEIPVFLASLPLLGVLVLNYIFTKIVQGIDPSIMDQTSMIPLAAQIVPIATWALIGALVIGIVLAVALGAKQFKMRGNLQTALNAGVIGSLLAIMNTASEVGYGSVISKLPGFFQVRDALASIDPGTPLVSEAITVNLLAGITGSASGGLSIALETMGPKYLEWGLATGVSPELLHRVASMSCGGFDTMPHNGAVITLLAICGMTHKKSYPDIGMVSLVVPFSVTFFLIAVYTLFGIA